ncbi:uncharacterized protein LOC124259265 [Haliotis rubra]|uniref:uncharacterized protein LOC124259265 n=1 Tax=Haliotis rubra TaxID=36100 RepID=UPI001EE52E79|nr:uncharacterized protein LOC124259265 [Haliotis rubra]
MGPTASSQEERSTKDTSPDDSKGDATLTVVLIIFAIVFVLCTGVMVWKRNQIWQFLERQCTTDEEKTSVPCCQEQGICESANSKVTPLTHSLGPICQPVTETRHENKADQYLYTETFAEIDLRYAVLDEPFSQTTTPSLNKPVPRITPVRLPPSITQPSLNKPVARITSVRPSPTINHPNANRIC